MLNVTPTEYVWKYNPLSGIPAGAQQNYGATVDWVLPGGRVMQHAIETINSRALSPDQIARRTAFFEYESDQQPVANNREANYIAANAIDSGTPRNGLYPLPFQGRQRVQLAGGSTEGMTQLSGGRNEGRIQLSGGRHPRPCSARHGIRPPRWSGINLSGNGLPEQFETASDAQKVLLRTQGPSVLVKEPGIYSRREFMTTFVPAVVPHPFNSQEPGQFPGAYSAIYKGRTNFEDTFWDW